MTTKALYERYWQERLAADASGRGEIIELLAATLPPATRVLDIGCGTGAAVALARTRAATVHACDVSETAAHMGREAGARTVCADVNGGLPYADRAFDAVTCLEVIEHVLDPALLLREAWRVLRPRGVVLLTTPNIRYVRHIRRLLVDGRFPHTARETTVWGGGHLHYFTRHDLRVLLLGAGFIDVGFAINAAQFARSWKRRWLRRLMGPQSFGEWLCAGIFAQATKP